MALPPQFSALQSNPAYMAYMQRAQQMQAANQPPAQAPGLQGVDPSVLATIRSNPSLFQDNPAAQQYLQSLGGQAPPQADPMTRGGGGLQAQQLPSGPQQFGLQEIPQPPGVAQDLINQMREDRGQPPAVPQTRSHSFAPRPQGPVTPPQSPPVDSARVPQGKAVSSGGGSGAQGRGFRASFGGGLQAKTGGGLQTGPVAQDRPPTVGHATGGGLQSGGAPTLGSQTGGGLQSGPQDRDRPEVAGHATGGRGGSGPLIGRQKPLGQDRPVSKRVGGGGGGLSDARQAGAQRIQQRRAAKRARKKRGRRAASMRGGFQAAYQS